MRTRTAPTPKNWPDETDPAWWMNRLRVRAKVIAYKEAHGESTAVLRDDILAVARDAVEAGTPLGDVNALLATLGEKRPAA